MAAPFPDEHSDSGDFERQEDDHIKRHYLMTHEEINPTRIVPVGPHVDW